MSFAAAYGGERVLANILIPKNVRPPYQTVVWFPGSYALELKSSARDLPFSVYFDFMARSGRALVYPVYSGTYERRRPAAVTGPSMAPAINEERDEVVRWAKDFSRTLDYLESRGDFDSRRTAYYGYSLGAWSALPILGVERRLATAILLTGGVPPVAPPPEIDPVNFLPRAVLPVLMLGGRYDFICPVETSQKPCSTCLARPPETSVRDFRQRRTRAAADRIDSRGARLAGPLPGTCAALDPTSSTITARLDIGNLDSARKPAEIVTRSRCLGGVSNAAFHSVAL